MAEAAILIIDDEPNIRKLVGNILEDEGYRVFASEGGAEGLRILERESVGCVLLDVWLLGANGIDILQSIKMSHSEVQVIMISGHANIDLAVKALKLGAYDFLEKPLGAEKLLTLVGNALEFTKLKRENRQLKKKLRQHYDLVGTSAAMAEVRRLIEKAARSDAAVFIQGENGSGKELVAREIHRLSAREAKPFVAVNCAAIPETLIESELFGHEKGAFTGANAQRKGRFELADEGSLFLDEIVDLSLSAQAKVLRVLQEQQFERVGGTGTVSVNVRIISASNRDAYEAMLDKNFREDLFYRLHVFPITVPPLRERTEDIPLLVAHFIREERENNPSFGDVLPEFSPEALAVLGSYSWPGNIRQLKNIVQRILVMSTESLIDRSLVEFALEADKVPEAENGAVDSPSGSENQDGTVNLGDYASMNLSDAKDSFEKELILQKLREHGYNISKAAQALGIYPSHLHGKIKKFNITMER